jgi:predicted permease
LSIRALAKSPGFTAVALLTLALGIGANTAMFTVLNAVLLRALPVRNPQQLVMLSNPEYHGIGVGDGSGARGLYAYSEFEALRNQNQVFSGIFAADSYLRKVDVAVDDGTRGGESERAGVSMVSGDYFRVLGIRPFLGRTFTTDVDKVQHANSVAVISHGYWKSRFALDPSILSRKIRIRRTTFDIIGVAQPGFSGETVGFSADMWVPLTMQAEVFPAWTNFLVKPTNPLGKILWLQVIARLKPRVTREQAQAGINVTLRQIRQADVEEMPADRRREYLDSRIQLVDGSRGANNLSESVGEPLKILTAVVGLILLIACANVANLVLARGATRLREIAVRLALGAGRRRLLQQLLTESVVLAVIGGGLGIILAQWADALLLRLVSTGSNPLLLDLRPDGRILAFTLGVSVLTGILSGLVPGFHAVRLELNSALKGAAKGAVRGRGHERHLPAGRILVIGQIALSLSVLIVAGLFVHSFQNLAWLNPGFDHDHLLQFDIGFLEASGYKGTAIHQVHKELLARLQNIPGVKGSTLAFMGLFAGNDSGSQISVDGSRPKIDPESHVRNDLVGPNYFNAIGQPLLMGREFVVSDERSAQLVGVINQTLARKYFAKSNPVGKRIWFNHDRPQQFIVVGVVGDAKHNSLREPDTGQFYLPFFNAGGDEPSFCSFQIRYSGNLADVAAGVRAAVKEAAPAVPPVEIRTMNELMGESLTTERVVSQLSSFFGLLALLLASIGLYGVISYNVASRTNEIGIRLAIGAQPRDILRIVLRETMILIAAGVALGLPSVVAARSIISSQLYGVTAFDPVAISVATLVLAVVALAAGYVPARWASRVDPMTALHYEG